jgi:hypothetical protein
MKQMYPALALLGVQRDMYIWLTSLMRPGLIAYHEHFNGLLFQSSSPIKNYDISLLFTYNFICYPGAMVK